MRIIMPGTGPKPLIVVWMLCLASLSTSATSIESCLSSQNQTELNMCMSVRLEREEEKLSAIYAGYMSSLSELQRQKFKDVQDNWRNFVHSSCAFQSSGLAGGTMYQTAIANCEARLVRDRYEEIDFLKRCGIESLSCSENAASD